MPLMTWELPPAYPPEFTKTLPKCNRILRQYLWNRNLTDPEYVEHMFNGTVPHSTDPLIMKDMRKGVARIWEAIDNQEHIVIFGDYDADGVTSVVSMYEGLLGLGAKINWYAPDRLEGYGTTPASLITLLAEFPTMKLLLTVDNGITAKATAEAAAERGITMIVTDHHNVEASVFPHAAYAVINPQQLDCPYPDNGLAGCGVAVKFVDAMVKYAIETGRKLPKGVSQDYADQWVDLQGIGTLCDVMSMLSLENRSIVKRAIERIQMNPRIGIKALCESSAWEKYPIKWRDLTPTDIGFKIGPCLNASGRMKSPKYAIYLLLSKHEGDAHQIATDLIDLNNSRKLTQQLYASELKARLAEVDTSLEAMPVIIQYIPACPAGIIGLLAGDMARVYTRPAIILTEKDNVDDRPNGTGSRLLGASCRSVDGFDIASALTKCDKLLYGHGGHSMAAGFTIPEVNLEPFIDMMYDVARQGTEGDKDRAVMVADLEIPLAYVDWNLYEVLKLVEPNGANFPAIKLLTRNLRVTDYAPLGKTKIHLKMEVTDDCGNTYEAIGWGFGEWVNDMPEYVDAIYRLEESSFAGQTILRLQLDALKPTTGGTIVIQGTKIEIEPKRTTQEIKIAPISISVTRAKELLGSGTKERRL